MGFSQNRYALIIGATVFALTFLTFFPVLNYEFLNWDDQALVKDNTHIRDLSGEGIATMFSEYCLSNYTPLERLSYALDYKIFGNGPWGFHFTNILLHSFNAVWIFLLTLKIFSLIAGENQKQGLKYFCSALAALIFSLHPQRLESVAWIAERRDVLALFFMAPCILCYLEWTKSAPKTRRRDFLGAATFALFICSLLSKASGIPVPAVLFLLDYFPLKRFGLSFNRDNLRKVLRCGLEKLPFLTVSITLGLVAISGQHMRGAMPDQVVYPLIARIANASLAVLFYIQKWLVPHSLSPIYATASHRISLFDPQVILCVLWILLVCGYSFWMIRRRPGFFVAWWSFLALIALFTGLVQAGKQSAADRYSYLATIPLGILFSWVLYRCLEVKRAQLIVIASMALWLGFLVTQMRSYLPTWRNSIALWETVLAEVPHEQIPLNNFSSALIAQKKYHLAVVMARAATQKSPRWDDAWHNYGTALSLTSRSERAIAALEQTLKLNPAAGDTHFAMGNLYYLKGDYKNARDHYFQAVQDKGTAEYYLNLGRVLYQTRSPSLAMKYFSRAAFQNEPMGFILMAEILAKQSEFEKARGLLTLAYRRIPDNRILEAHQKLIEMDPKLSEQQKRNLMEALPKFQKH